MKQWGMKNFAKRSSLLALAGAVAAGTAACGGGSSSTTTTTTSGTSTLTGVAAKGPLTSPTVTYNGSTVSTTVTTGAFSFTGSLPSGTTVYKLVFSGGTDAVTSTTPIMDLTTLVTSSTSTINANAITSLIAAAAIQAAGGTTATLSTSNYSAGKSVVMNTFSFGMDGAASGSSSFDPFTTSVTGLTAQQAAEYALAVEGAGEMLRRTQVATGAAIATLLLTIGTELSDGVLDTDTATNAPTMNTLMLAAAAISLEVINRSLTVSSSATTVASSSFATAWSTSLGTTPTTPSSSLTATSSLLASATKTIWATAGAYLIAAFGSDTGGWTVQAAALSSTSSLSAMQTATASITSTTVNTSALSTAASVSSVTALSYANSAYDAGSATNTIMVEGSGGTKPYITDYPSNTATTLTLDTPALSGQVLDISLPSTSTLSASNLTLVAAGSRGTSQPPLINFALSNVPNGSGTATVSLLLKEGTSTTRTSAQRSLKATFDINWAADGTFVTLTLPASGTAYVTYYTSGATTASSVTLSNTAADGIVATASGSTQSALEESISVRIATLFDTTTTLGAALNSPSTTGQFFYQIIVDGLTMGIDQNNDGDISDSSEGTFNTIQGTFISL